MLLLAFGIISFTNAIFNYFMFSISTFIVENYRVHFPLTVVLYIF